MRDYIVWVPLILSALIGVVCAVILRKSLNQSMGLPSWDFSRSWASNITVVGGLVSLSALTFIPAPKKVQLLETSEYPVLIFVFPLLATLAPLVYNFSRHVSSETTAGGPVIVAVGRAYMFILASVLTMWAAAGQLALQAAILEELRKAEVVQSSISILLELLLAFIAIGLVCYGGKTVVETVRIQKPESRSPATSRELALGETHAQNWTLL